MDGYEASSSFSFKVNAVVSRETAVPQFRAVLLGERMRFKFAFSQRISIGKLNNRTSSMGIGRLVARFIGLFILLEVINGYLTTADDELVLIDEGPGRFSLKSNWSFLNPLFSCIPVCYSVVFSGRRVSHRYIERSVAVISLDECKLLCTRETSFDCRSFNYRYVS